MIDVAAQPSPLDTAAAGFLPGMESHAALPLPLSETAIQRLPVHTADHLFSSDKPRYALAVALFFGAGLTQRMVCSISGISPHTLASIIARESKGATADQWREAMSGDLRAITAMALSVSRELLTDPQACKSAGIRGVATLLRECVAAHEILQGRSAPDPVGAEDKEAAAREYLESLDRAQSKSIQGWEKIEAREGETVPVDGGRNELLSCCSDS